MRRFPGAADKEEEMMRSRLWLSCAVLGLVCIPLCSTARAQFSSDFQTNVISGVTSNWAGDYVVGSKTVFDLLRIENGGLLSNDFGYIGYEANATNNSVTVTGSNSTWINSITVYVGFSGSGNSLVVGNGGVVASFAGFVGLNGNASNNSVVVTGSGSAWRNSVNLSIGDGGGSGNSLVISDGAMVVSSGGEVGGGFSTANDNSALVAGIGSIWSNASSLSVGVGGSDNSLIVSNGGVVVNTEGIVGFNPNASNNVVTIIGNGSTWQNQSNLFVVGSRNRLTIADDGSVVASNVYVNANPGIAGNVINVLGGHLYVPNGSIYIGHGSGDDGIGEMNISNGTVAAQSLIVGNSAGSQGAINIFGGSVTASRIVVCELPGSTGRFFASNASVIAPASAAIKSGEMYLSNSTALVGFLFLAGPGSHGTLSTIGSTLTVAGDLSIGDYLGTGVVWITGGQLVATNGTTYVSNLGSGQMTCSNSLVNLATLTVSASSFQVGTLTVSGGSLSARQFDVAHGGFASTGAVWICDGASATATNDPSIVGESGIGTMTISNSTIRMAALTLGKAILVDTQGTLTVAGGMVGLTGTLTAGEQGLAGTPAAAKGTIWLTGGQLIATNAPSYIGLTGIGQMDISNGVFLAQAVTVAGANSTLTIAGGNVLAGNMALGTPNCDGTGMVTVTSGNLFVTNASHNAVLEVRSGTMVVSGGTVVIDTLVITNACGHFVHSGGVLSVGTLVLDPSLDADGDGMPNGWEQAYGFDPLTPHANADSDGDGLTDLQEFLAGTDPTNSASAFKITALAQEGSDIRVTWMTGIGRTNALQATTDSLTSFADIFTVTNTAGPVTNYVDTGAVTNWAARFYRARLVP